MPTSAAALVFENLSQPAVFTIFQVRVFVLQVPCHVPRHRKERAEDEAIEGQTRRDDTLLWRVGAQIMNGVQDRKRTLLLSSDEPHQAQHCQIVVFFNLVDALHLANERIGW